MSSRTIKKICEIPISCNFVNYAHIRFDVVFLFNAGHELEDAD